MPWKMYSQEEQRQQFIEDCLRRTKSIAELCRVQGVSRKTAYKWIGRFKQASPGGWQDRPRSARVVHNRPARLWLERIRRWRTRHPSWGAAKLRWVLRQRFGGQGLPSEAAVGRWLKAWKLTRCRRKRAHKGPRIQRPALSQARRPNEVWTVDFKGPFRTKTGCG